MRDFHQSHMRRPTENEKKEKKIKNHFHPGDNCNCFSPFMKVHHHNCPMVLKPCPIHGNEFYSEEKEQNVVISFHPSSKTEKLFQPIKSLLAHCNSGTKINFQYYSPSNSISKESIKASYNQNTYNLKKTLNSNTFMDKTKSFVAEKTSRVKKLKQCFYSPCNSIAQKTRSQTSINERLNQILRDETKQTRNVFYNLVPEMPPDDKNWFYSNLGGFKNKDKLFDEKMESDFITVTQHDKNNVINHKIFEIKHNKGGNDVPFVGFPKQQTQFVYSSVNAGGPTMVQGTRSTPKQVEKEKPKAEKVKHNGPDISSSEKTHRSISSSSSGSVYVTPFFFVPKGMRDSDSDFEEETPVEELKKVDKGVQANDFSVKKPHLATQGTQTSLSQYEQLSALTTKPTESSNSEPKSKSVLLQTEFLNQSSKSSSEQSGPQYTSKTTVEEIYVNNERVYNKKRSRAVSEGTGSTQSRSTGVQAGTSCLYREVMISARWGSNTKDKISQTDDKWNLQVSVKAIESKVTKSKISADKEIQTAVSRECSENSEYLQLNSPNVIYVIKPFDEMNSDHDIDKHAKMCWGKAHSDSDLHERMRCGCWKPNNEDPVLQEEGTKDFKEKKSPVTTTKTYECVATETETDTAPNTRNVVLRTKETFERLAVTKETSTMNDTVSDLSELKRIIQEIFERSNIPGKKACECDEKKPSKDKKVEPEAKAVKSSEAPKRKQTKDSQVQTDFRVLLNEAEQGKMGKQKVKLRDTVLVDEENQTRTFYICDVCGRDIIKYSAHVGTNTETPRKENYAKKIPKRDEDLKKLAVETYEIAVQTKRIKGTKAISNDTKSLKASDSHDMSQPGSVHKTAIPVPVNAHHLRANNTENNLSKGRECQIQISEERKSKTTCYHNHKIPVIALLEDCIPGPSSSPECRTQAKCYITQIPSTCSKTMEGTPNGKPDPRRDQGRTQNKKTNSDFNYCLLVAQPWPRDLVSGSSDIAKEKGSNTLNDEPISGTLNQKRSSQKVMTSNTGGKKTKEKLQEPTWWPMLEKSLSSKLLNAGKNDPIRIWFSGKPPHQEDNCEVNDEVPPIRENSLENLKELSEELVELADDEDDTPVGNGGSEEEELGGEEEEIEDEAIDERFVQFLRESSTTFQTHPSMTFNRLFNSNGPSTTKSLNRFSSIRQPKKRRRTLV